MAESNIKRSHRRFRRHQARTIAASLALDEAARSVPGPLGLRLASAARRTRSCGLSFRVRLVTPPNDATRLVIQHRRACQITICMLCAQQKSRRLRADLTPSLEAIQAANPTAPFVMLTLTDRNRPFRELKQAISDFEEAEKKLFRLAAIRRAVLGTIRNMEIAVRGTPDAPETGVHAHYLLRMHDDYYSRDHKYYLDQKVLVAMWAQCLRTNDQPVIDIRRVRDVDGSLDGASLGRGIKEIVKYALKPSSVFVSTDQGLKASPFVVATLMDACFHRRMLRITGVFASTRKRLRSKT